MKMDHSGFSRDWKQGSLFSDRTTLPTEASGQVGWRDSIQTRAGVSERGNFQGPIDDNLHQPFSRGLNSLSSPDLVAPEEDDVNYHRVPVSKHIDSLALKFSQYSGSDEDSKSLVSDKVQWHLDYELEIPVSIKQRVLQYKQNSNGPVRLERRLNGTEGVLYYIMGQSLLMWLYRENVTLAHDFDEDIQSVRRPCCQHQSSPSLCLSWESAALHDAL